MINNIINYFESLNGVGQALFIVGVLLVITFIVLLIVVLKPEPKSKKVYGENSYTHSEAELEEKLKDIDNITDDDININNDEPHSYKDIVCEKNELEYTQDEVKNLEKKYKELKSKTALNDLSVYESKIETRNDFKVLITKVENQDTNVIKDIVDTLLNKMGTGLILIANVCGNQASLIIRNNIENKSAGDLMKQIAKELNGNGGGSNTFAQGAGKDITKLDEVLNSVKEQL